MALYLRGNTWWIDVSANNRRVRCSSNTQDREVAKRQHDRLRASLWDRETRQTVLFWRDAVTMYMLTNKTAGSDSEKEAFFTKAFGDTPIHSLTTESIRTAVETGKRQQKKSTRNRYYAFIRAVLNYCRKTGHLVTVPHIQMWPEDNKRVRFLKPEEIERLKKELPDYLRAPFLLSLYTGLRMRNVTHMKWRDVDLKNRVVRVPRTKNGEPLTIPLNTGAYNVLSEQHGWTGWGDNVFLNSYDEQMDDCNTPAFRAALKRAGIEDFRFHDVRHTWASWLIQQGVTTRELAELGGWKSEKMVERYAHLSPSQLRSAAAKIDQVMEAI